MEDVSRLLKFVSENIWPLITLVALILFRKPLSTILMKMTTLNLKAGRVSLKTEFSRHVSAEIAEVLVRNPDLVKLDGERRLLTIVYLEFQDIDVASERLTPEYVIQVLRQYSIAMIDVIFEFGGTLDRYTGRTLIAYWGAPITYEDPAERACKAALKMIEKGKLRPATLKQHDWRHRPCIAITTGNLIIGNLGSKEHPNYSIMGEILNILPALCSLNREHSAEILMTEYTRAHISDKFKTRLLSEAGPIRVKGKEFPIDVYELLQR